VYLRIANRALGVVEQNADRTCANVQSTQAPPGAVELLARVLGVVAEVLVPMTAGAGLASAEDDLLDADVRRCRLGGER
jgi:hypothetical protein